MVLFKIIEQLGASEFSNVLDSILFRLLHLEKSILLIELAQSSKALEFTNSRFSGKMILFKLHSLKAFEPISSKFINSLMLTSLRALLLTKHDSGIDLIEEGKTTFFKICLSESSHTAKLYSSSEYKLLALDRSIVDKPVNPASLLF